jgi:hypothetical protein
VLSFERAKRQPPASHDCICSAPRSHFGGMYLAIEGDFAVGLRMKPLHNHPASSAWLVLIRFPALALTLIACSTGSWGSGRSTIGSPTVTASVVASASVPAGWTTYQLARMEASFALPGEWIAFSASDGPTAFDEARDEHPDEAALIDNAETTLGDGEISLIAFEPGAFAKLGFAPSVTVVGVPEASTQDPKTIATQMAAAIERDVRVKGAVTAGTASVSAGRVALVTYVAPVEAADGRTVDVRIMEFGFAGQPGFVLSLATPDSVFDDYHQLWQQIADSAATE